MTENWLPVVGREETYEVSDLGRVRSLRTGIVLSQHLDHKGYPKVTLSPDATHDKWTLTVHRLVVAAFHGPRPFPKAVTRHLDGNPANNHASNLRWGTYSQNNLDRTAHGTDHLASRDACNYGHPFDAANTYLRRDGAGGRRCRTCARDQQRKRYHALLAA